MSTSDPPELLPPSSRRHQVAASLRSAIVSGRLLPGDRLTETHLAERLGTSRAPVREALRQLEQEGLVATHPYRGTEVLGVTQEEIEHVLVPIRLTIERFAFRKALPHLTEADLAALEVLVRSMRHAAADGDADALAEADVRFHELVILRSRQEQCLRLWRTIEPRIRAYFRRDAPAHPSPSDVPDQHQELLDVLTTRDEQGVVEALEGHIREFLVLDDRDNAD